MKKRKKGIVVLIACILTFMLLSCGSEDFALENNSIADQDISETNFKEINITEFDKARLVLRSTLSSTEIIPTDTDDKFDVNLVRKNKTGQDYNAEMIFNFKIIENKYCDFILNVALPANNYNQDIHSISIYDTN